MKIFSTLVLTFTFIGSTQAMSNNCPSADLLANIEIIDATPIKPSPSVYNLYQVHGKLHANNKAWIVKSGFFKANGPENAIYTVQTKLQNHDVNFVGENNGECKYTMIIDFPWGWTPVDILLIEEI